MVILEKPRMILILFSSAQKQILFISREVYFREFLLYLTNHLKSTGWVL
jgi:hypothetical protein